MESIKRYYFQPAVWSSVINSQVFNWIKLLNEKDIETDCISLSNNSLSESEVLKIEQNIGGKFYQFGTYTLILNDIFVLSILLRFYFKAVFKYDKIIFQTRVPSIGIAFGIIGLFYKTKVIYEARGAAVEERFHSHRNKKNKTRKLKFKIQTKFMEINEKWFIKNSNIVICVSHRLKEYYINKYNIKSTQKFHVYPGAADSSLFFYNSSLRDQCRKELGLPDNKMLVIYVGAYKKEWEIPDSVFNFMSSLISLNSNIVFLSVTPDVELANNYAKKYNMEGNCIILKSKFKDVNKYLNGADMSLMLREDVLMNNVASPTKYSEYILAGLPTIMSNGVTDFANLTNKKGFGLVLADYSKLSKPEYNKIMKLIDLDRDSIANWGIQNLSKEVMIKKYYKMLKDV